MRLWHRKPKPCKHEHVRYVYPDAPPGALTIKWATCQDCGKEWTERWSIGL